MKILKVKDTWPVMGAPAPFLLGQPVFQNLHHFWNKMDFVKLFLAYATKLDECMFIWLA